MAENVLPTRMVLQQQKAKLQAAKRGHDLLKKKSESLSKKFREILSRIVDAKEKLIELVGNALFSMTQVRFAAGDFIKYNVLESVGTTAPTRVKMRYENVSGVALPTFELEREGFGSQEFAGLAKAGKAIQDSQELFLQVIEQVVKLASLQTAFAALDEVIKITNRRVNALEYVVIPKVEGIIHYIEGEMSESEREEFFRLKMMQKTKKRKADEEEAAAKLAEEEAIKAGLLPPGKMGSATAAADMLGGDDEDIVV